MKLNRLGARVDSIDQDREVIEIAGLAVDRKVVVCGSGCQPLADK